MNRILKARARRWPTLGVGCLLLSSAACQSKAPPSKQEVASPVPSTKAAPLETSRFQPKKGQKLGPRTRAKELAKKLGKDYFLIGFGNDLNENHDQDGAYTIGPPVDLHYAYLVGLKGKGGWPDWNPDGSFVRLLTDSADRHQVVPMFTLYSMAAAGEGRIAVLEDAEYMKAYLDGARLLFERLGEFKKPAIVQLEPDFWGFAQKHEPDPARIPARVEEFAKECQGLGNHLSGFGRCLVKLSRTYSPAVLIGLHASTWAHTEPKFVADFLLDAGLDQADFISIETLDRDAGCFEAAKDPNCQRGPGPFYWDETNRTSPNFHEHLHYATELAEHADRPLLWWQMPLGVPSDTPGGKPTAYRDNRVRYLFSHVDEFVKAGGLGAAFGVGAAGQTYFTTDGGQFKSALSAYRKSPTLLIEDPNAGGR